MRIVKLFTDRSGRLRRSTYVLAMVGLGIGLFVAMLPVAILFAWLETSGYVTVPHGQRMPNGLIIAIGTLAAIANVMTAVLVGKRMNDAAVPAWNRPSYFWVVLVAGLVSTASVVTGLLGGNISDNPAGLVTLVMIGIAGGLPPEMGENDHGPDPRGGLADDVATPGGTGAAGQAPSAGPHPSARDGFGARLPYGGQVPNFGRRGR